MNRQVIINILREFRFLGLVDRVYFRHVKKRYTDENKWFLANHPGEVMPPDDMLYEIMGHCSYGGYWDSGINDAKWLTTLIENHSREEELHVAEWGCGPARVIRHIKATHASYPCYGFDYDRKTLDWCKNNIPGCFFLNNNLSPPLPVDSDTMDVLYSLSVFTHLSEQMHMDWIDEIWRVLRPGGLFIGTFHGEKFRDRLLPSELGIFDTRGCVVRAKVMEGSKNYSAYQSATFIKDRLLKKFIDVREVVDISFHQNIWCATKPNQMNGSDGRRSAQKP